MVNLKSFIQKLMKITKHVQLKNTVALPLLTFFISLWMTYQVFHFAKIEVMHKAQVYFDFRVREVINQINQGMQAYEQALLGTAALFKASKHIERDEFKQYVATLNLTKIYPGVQGIGFSLIVPSAKKTEHIASIRSEGFPEYTIRPDSPRDIYTSIIYLEPFSDRNLLAFGYDMFSHPMRHVAMQKAIDTGKVALSGKVKLIQESGRQEQAGFLMYLPIYRNGTNNVTLSERREHILGWVYLPFRMNDLMNGLFSKKATDLHIKIYDGESMLNKALMYDSGGSNLATVNELGKTLQVQIAGHTWTIYIQPSLPISSLVDANYPKLVAAIGITISVLLSLLVWLLVTGRKNAGELGVERQRLDSILEGTHVGTWEWNVQTGSTKFNDRWASVIGYELSELEPTSIETWMNFVHPDDAKVSGKLLEKYFSGELAYYECEARMRHKNGQWIWVLYRGKVATWTPDGKPLLMFGTQQEISQRKQLELELTKQAHLDYLTGLSNRRHFMSRGEVELSRAIRYDTPLSLMMLDIDFFKNVNDTYGHQVGDTVLQVISKICQDTLRQVDLAGRLGGEEFAVILPETAAKEALEVAERLREAIAKSEVTLPTGLPIHFTASIGVTTLRDKNVNFDMLLNQADKALYEAKGSGRNKSCVG